MTSYDMLVTLLLGYPLAPEMVDPRFPAALQHSAGLWLTLLITILSLMIGGVIGTALALCRREIAADTERCLSYRVIRRALRCAATGITEIVRGLPIMLLVLLMFYLPYRVLELRLPSFFLATAVFSLYAGVYLAEIIRAGSRSVGGGLLDAGKLLGLSKWKVLTKIEAPLICQNMMPDIISLAVTVFKDTSTLSVVAVAELTYTARQMLMSEPASYGLVWLVVLVFYWAAASCLTACAIKLERRRISNAAGGGSTSMRLGVGGTETL